MIVFVHAPHLFSLGITCFFFYMQGTTYYYHVITRMIKGTRPTETDADGSVTMELASSDEVKVRTTIAAEE